MAPSLPVDNIIHIDKSSSSASDIEKQHGHERPLENVIKPRILSEGTAIAIGAFSTTLTTLSLSLLERRGLTTQNASVANFFFVAALGLLITAQWELVAGNSYAYTVFSAFGLFYGGFGVILTPAFGVYVAYGDDIMQLNNALGFFIIPHRIIFLTVFAFVFLIASLPMNLVYTGIFFTVVFGFLLVASSYFAAADGHLAASVALKKSGGGFCFVDGLIGWYLTFALLLRDSIVVLSLGDTSRYFLRR